MLLTHHQANVREEKPTVCIMWISISVRVLMMYPMSSRPIDNTLLETYGLQQQKNEVQWSVHFVTPVRPVTMCSSGNSERGNETKRIPYN